MAPAELGALQCSKNVPYYGYKLISIDIYRYQGFDKGRTIHVADRRRRKNPKTEKLFLRLTPGQMGLLKRYVDYRGFETEAAGIRAMIDGLEDWFLRQEANERAAVTSVATKKETRDSGLPRVTDVPASDEAIDVDASVGDFGGRPSVGLPESRHDGME